MTVKLTNFFSSNAAAMSHPNTTPGATVTGTMASPTPPITHAASTAVGSSSYLLYQQQPQQLQQQLQQKSYNPYLAGHVDVGDDGDLYDDDNMSLYSNATSASGIMTQRGHSCNNSQRPLLGERNPPKMLLLSTNATKKTKKSLSSTSNSINQPQRHLQQKQRQQGKPQMLQQSKSYISPYVQQQKRDSAKGLHGFNDFDILSQQYTEHLRSSPHIGYPYGSPPSPTAKSNDFVFDTLIMPQKRAQQQQQTRQQQQQHQQYSSQQIVENDINETDYSYYARNVDHGNGSSSNSSNGSGSASVGSLGHLSTINNAAPSYQFIGKPSRFEDDFCTRRNATFAAPQAVSTAQSQQQPLASMEKSWMAATSAGDIGGPFVFGGVPHERFTQQQQQHQQEQINGDNKPQRDFNNSPLPLTTNNSTDTALDVSDKYSPYIGEVIVQSSSDTSSSSRDSSSNKGAKFLLRKGKSKRNTKDKKTETPAVQVKAEQQKQHETPSIKCVLVGDGAVGKTNLILSYLKNRFNTEHVPTASDIYNADVLVNDSPVRLTICDTAGQDTLDKLRQLCYPDSDVFLLCFSVVKPDTFNAVKTKWAPKFSKTKAALLLVGTQADLRNDAQVLNKLQLNGEKPISYADGWDLAATVGAKYIETSSATQDKVKEVFDTAIWEGLAPTTLPPTPTPPLWKKLLCLA